MTSFTRRDWLRTAGLAGLAALFHTPTELLAGPHLPKGETPEALIRLNANENPYAPSQAVQDAIVRAFAKAARYPYLERPVLRQRLAEKHGLTEAHILDTVGSTEGLKIAGLVLGGATGSILAARPTFLAMLSFAEKFGTYIDFVPVDEALVHDLEAMERHINNQTRLVFICNPNNPTGTILPPDELEAFCRRVARRCFVFVDEAYIDYIEQPGYPSMVKLVKEGLNVIVSRTFSKVYGLAGLRVGYLMARPDIIARLAAHQVERPNQLGIAAALAALDDEAFYRYSLEQNARAKRYVYALLDELGRRYVPSQTNFVFFHTGKDIDEVNAFMRGEGLWVGRPFPPLRDWCRVSMGTLDEMERFGAALKKMYG